MTTLYRSPNVLVDGIEFHVTVEQHKGRRPVTRYYFRTRNPTVSMWAPVEQFQGRLPKGMRRFFKKYRGSIADALATAETPAVRKFPAVDVFCPF